MRPLYAHPPYAGLCMSLAESRTYSCVSMVLGSLHSCPLMVKNQRRVEPLFGPVSINRKLPFHTTRNTVSSRFLTKSHDCDKKRKIGHKH